MHDTRFYDSAEIIPALARGYTINDKGVLRAGYCASNSYSRWGELGIISTAHDMVLWTNELKSSHLINASLHAAIIAANRFSGIPVPITPDTQRTCSLFLSAISHSCC